jgi:hypothetical protein
VNDVYVYTASICIAFDFGKAHRKDCCTKTNLSRSATGLGDDLSTHTLLTRNGFSSNIISDIYCGFLGK